MRALFDRLGLHRPSLHRKAEAVVAHAQLWLTAGLVLALLVIPGQRTAVAAPKPSVSRGEATQARSSPSKAAAVARTTPAEVPHTRPPAPVAPAAAVPAAAPVPAAEPPTKPPPVETLASTGLPDTGADYRATRRKLLAGGFKPAHVAPPECRGPEPSVDACWGPLVEFPEIEACTSGAKAACTGWWMAPDGRVLKIRTQGEKARISDRHWASQDEIDELPRGWRP